MVIVIILLSLFVFFIIRLVPGDPILIFIGRSQQVQAMSPELYEHLRHQYGLDRPLIVQYGNWVGDILQGDLGTSLFYSEDVGTLLKERFPVTLFLGALSLLVAPPYAIS